MELNKLSDGIAATFPGGIGGTVLQAVWPWLWGCIRKKPRTFSGSGSGGGYLLSHFRSTIGVVRLNFSVRNGKRWIPHAITTLVFFSVKPLLLIAAPVYLGASLTDSLVCLKFDTLFS